MKNKLVYGVTMTSLQAMMFGRYISNQGIAMNTLTKEERFEFAKNWIKNHSPEVGKMVI